MLEQVEQTVYSPLVTPRKLTQTARLLRKHDTWAEQLLWRWLRDRKFSAYKFRRQHPFGEYILDFFCVEARLNIELDGRQHGMPKNSERDARRDAELERKGIKVLRFWNSRLKRDKEVIRNKMWQMLQERAPHPLPAYCRPGVVNASKKHATPLSPSPQPSPSGRGRAFERDLNV